MDLQVLIPRTIDVAKTAAVNEHQSVTQQQQLSTRLKNTVEAQQHQVQSKMSSQHDGRVTTEDLDREKQKERQQHEAWDEKEIPDVADTDSDKIKNTILVLDPLRGHTIDIKT
jgi:hypothetical protein